MGDLPSGTLTFLFTDLEGSTALWESQPDVMREAVARHDELLAEAVEACGGQVVKNLHPGRPESYMTDRVHGQTLGRPDGA